MEKMEDKMRNGEDCFPVTINEFDVNKKLPFRERDSKRYEIVKNKIHYITKLEMQDRLPFSGFVAIFDGKQIQYKEELFHFLEKTVGLPDTNNWSSITDWLTDLSWIKSETCTFIFENDDSFLKDDLSSKDLFLEILEEDVLPWWESDVEKHVVGGKVKSFQVYIVEN